MSREIEITQEEAKKAFEKWEPGMSKKYVEVLDTMSREIFGIKRSEAQEQEICVCCKKPERHYSEQGRREFLISGLCEFCFDEITVGRIEAESGWRLREIPENEWPPTLKPNLPRRDKDDR